MAGCMRVRHDAAIDIYVLPRHARCECTGISPLEMDECPLHLFDTLGCECRPGECDEYTEDDESLGAAT